jgi:hypothetical protein
VCTAAAALGRGDADLVDPARDSPLQLPMSPVRLTLHRIKSAGVARGHNMKQCSGAVERDSPFGAGMVTALVWLGHVGVHARGQSWLKSRAEA